MTKPIPFGKYYLLDRINVGGMAEVFRAKAFGVEGFERLVAVKRILPSIAEDTEFISMFIDEAKLAVQLSHANIAQIFDLGKVADSYFIALEYVHGKDLRALFDRAQRRNETLPINLACYAVMKLCEGLDYAHNKCDPSGRPLELVHRDVSPQNVLISFDGEVKVIDFGIAKAAGNAGKTQTGILKGKFGYLSPEQVRGEAIDRRSDVFAVGICLCEVLTGQRLFGGESDFSSLEKVRTYEAVEPRELNADIPEELSRILIRALHRDVESRYASAMDLHDDLQAFLHAQDHTFGRRELSAWMRTAFPLEAEEGARSRPPGSTPPESADAVFEALKSAEVEQETVTNDQNRDVAAANISPPGAGAGSTKATILGMAPVGSGRAQPTGRTVPPPPPRSRTAPLDSEATPTRLESGPVPRTAPPAPPSRTQPPAPPRSGTLPPAQRLSGGTMPPALPPSGGTLRPGAVPVPVATNSTVGRTLPPPPRSTMPPSGGVDAGVSLSAQAQQSAQSPVLDMDWDDEELSTQIYDRPEGAAEFDSAPPARHIPTYIPPVSHSGVVPSGEWTPPASFESHPELSATPRQGLNADVLPGFVDTHTSDRRGNNTLLLAAIGVLAVTLVGFGIYTFTGSSEPAVLQLATVPTDARVTFDAQAIQGSASPFLIPSIEPGTAHVLEVSKEGFEPWSQSVMVTPGQRLEFTVALQPATGNAVAPPEVAAAEVDFDPKRTGFSIESSPPGASVYLNGDELAGVTPMRVTGLRPGRYNLRIELDGYEVPSDTSVDVAPDEVNALPKFVLVGEPVSVSFESTPPGAKVRLLRGSEVRTLGTTPLTSTLQPGGDAWTVEMRADGYAKFSRVLELTPGEPTARFSAELEASRSHRATSTSSGSASSGSAKSVTPAASPRSAPAATGTGTLRINSRPWSEVHVDGRSVGHTPQMNIRLPAGRHKVMLVNPEFGVRKTLNVTIDAGKTTTQIVNLD